jgi:hypothetical protein
MLDSDVRSAMVGVRIMARRAALFGFDAPKSYAATKAMCHAAKDHRPSAARAALSLVSSLWRM